MPPKARGSIEAHVWKDGRTTSYSVRVRYQGRRHRVDLGTNHEGWSEDRARVELDKILGQIERGTWQPPQRDVAPAGPTADEALKATCHRWWTAKKPTVKESTRVQYKWALALIVEHLGNVPLDRVDSARVRRFRDTLVAKQLSARSVNVVLRILTAVLEDAREDKLIDAQPVTKRHRLAGERKKNRSFLEPDMVRDMLDAASQLEAEARRDYKVGRRAIVATLTLAGLRRQELCDAKVGHLDLAHHRLKIPASKTEAGAREIELTLWLSGELRAHLADLRQRGLPAGPVAWLFPTRSGGQRDPDRLNDRIIQKCAIRATENRADQGGAELGHITPHALRRTFASLALAAGRDPKFVMDQLGHTSPEFTLRVYAQLMKRRRQDDQLIWEFMRFADEPDVRPGGRAVGSNGGSFDPRIDPTSDLPSADDSGRIDA